MDPVKQPKTEDQDWSHIYRPQENVTPNNELKLLYKTTAEQIEIAKEKCQQVHMVGDFNVKLGNHIPGNKETVSKGGRQLKRMIKKYNMNIINANEHKCKGKRTRRREINNRLCYYQSRIYGHH